MADSHTQEVLPLPKVDGVELPFGPQEISHEWRIDGFPVNRHRLNSLTYSQAFPKESLPQWHIELRQTERGVVVSLKLRKAANGRSDVASCSIKFIDDNGDVIHATTQMERRFRTPLHSLSGSVLLEELDHNVHTEWSKVSTILSQSGKLIIQVNIIHWGKVVNLSNRNPIFCCCQ